MIICTQQQTPIKCIQTGIHDRGTCGPWCGDLGAEPPATEPRSQWWFWRWSFQN